MGDDAQSCTSYCVIKHTMKMWERVIESMMRGVKLQSVSSSMALCQVNVPQMRNSHGRLIRAKRTALSMSLLIWKRLSTYMPTQREVFEGQTAAFRAK